MLSVLIPLDASPEERAALTADLGELVATAQETGIVVVCDYQLRPDGELFTVRVDDESR